MVAFDFKNEYKAFYMPKSKPCIVMVPGMNYIAVRGSGDPNQEDGEYKQSIGLLYGIAFTIKMSKKGGHRIPGYFDYVVPPLEGFWRQGERHPVDATLRTDRADRQERMDGIDYAHKEDFQWISVIRLPDFVAEDDFKWVVAEATEKKKQDFSKATFLTVEEGLCVQCMHIGPYDAEPATVAMMDQYLADNGYENDFSDERRHHEIYLSDARRVAPEKLKTVIRHPIRKKGD